MTNEMHAAESLDDTACSGQRALPHPSGGEMRAARNQTARPAAARSGGANPTGIVPGPAASPSPAAESLEDTAGGGLHVVNRLSGRPLAPEGNAARTNPLAGEGTSAAGMDVSSLNCARQASNPAGRLSREEYVCIATPLLAKGATWRQVGDACGLSPRAAQARGENAGLASKRGPGRPQGMTLSAETRARIAEGLRRRRLEGRR